MPTNRVRVDRRRSDTLNINQEGFLRLGFDCFPGWPGFEDEDHQREAWEANRERLMAGYDRPGRRPWAYWQFDWGFERVRDAHGDLTFAWPEPIQSEEEMVYDLLKRGQLKSCRLNGAIPIESEVRQIREDWLRDVALEARDGGPTRTTPTRMCGCPSWFYNEHAPAIIAQQQAEAAAWRAKMGRKPAGSLV